MRIHAALDRPVRLGGPEHPYREVFFIAFLTALSFLLPYIVLDQGLFLFFGDYCVQQVPFYQLAHDAIRSGNIWWNWNTDLGANFIGSYAFYLLGSPFFWLTVPLPSAAVPYMLGPLLALKMSVAAVTAYAYIRRFVKTNSYAMLGALLYAFSGYSIYNIFFNHFHEPMAFFPLLLLALEELMENDRRGFFAVTVLVCAFVNYNFFVADVVFVILYWLVRALSGAWELSLHKYLHLAFEAVIGFGMSCVLVIPAVLAILGNYRTTSYLSGWGLLVYDWPQRYLDIIHSVFFPQDLPSLPNFFPDSNAKWASVSAWMPMFSMAGVISLLIAKRGSWLRRIILVCFTYALIPVLNQSFMLFNSNYYGRWFYTAALMLALATAVAFESDDIDCMAGLRWTVLITAAFACIGLIPQMDGKKLGKIGLEADPARFWAYVVIVAAGLALLYLLLRFFRKGSEEFAGMATVCLIVIVCLYGNFYIATGKGYGWDGAAFKSTYVEGASKLKMDHSEFYRIDSYNAIDNLGMFWKLPTMNAFQSVVPASIINFYMDIGVQRDVGSRADLSSPALRPLLSVKYFFDESNATALGMPGWKRVGTQLGYAEWENENFIPMGFTFENYITGNQLSQAASRDRVLLKALVLSSDQIKRYSSILKPFNVLSADYSDAALQTDSAARRAHACSSFTTDNRGFSASITLPSPNLVFFSVPYDAGWKAMVNGKTARVEEVDNGMMAVLCPAGTSSIRFAYTTPGLYLGAAVTGGSAAVFALYLLLARRRRRVRAARAGETGDASEDAFESGPEGGAELPEPREELPEGGAETEPENGVQGGPALPERQAPERQAPEQGGTERQTPDAGNGEQA